MRKIKILSLIFAAVFMCLSLASCAKEAVTAHNVYVTVVEVREVDGEEKMYLIGGPYYGDVKGTESNPPTVLQATMELLEANKITVKQDDVGGIKKIKNLSDKVDEKTGMQSGWLFKLYGNDRPYSGVEPKDTRAVDTVIHDNDGIVYYYRTWENTELKKAAQENNDNEEDTEEQVDETGN